MKTYSGPVSDHFDGTHFFDPDGAPPKAFRVITVTSGTVHCE